MLHIGTLSLRAGHPRLALSFSDKFSTQDLIECKAQGLDLAEIRVDLFSSVDRDHVIGQLEKFTSSELPTILTIRPEKEGGKWSSGEESRLALLDSLVHLVDSVDLELSSLDESVADARKIVDRAKQEGTVLIISHHDFKGTPEKSKLQSKIDKALDCGADIVKVACLVNDSEDLSVLTEVLLEDRRKHHFIVIGMGAKGLISRLSFPGYGSLVTFGCNPGMPTAPGQPPFKELLKDLRAFYPDYNQEKTDTPQGLGSAQGII